MTMKRWDGANQVDTTTEKRWNGSAWVDLTIAKRWSGAAWIDIAFPGGGGAALSATADVGFLIGREFRFSPPAQPAVLSVGTDSPTTVTITATGGTGPYTYLWSHVSGDSAVQVGAPFANVTGFFANVGQNQTKAAVKRCTVTDSLGATTTVDVGASLTYFFEV